METSFSFFSSFFFWKVTRNTVWNSRPKILKSGRWFSSSPLPLVKLCPSLIYYRGYNGAKWLLFFFFFFFRKRKLGNTRVVHASLVSIIKNDGSLWRVEVFDLNNSVIQGRIYFHLNGGGNTFWLQRFENPEIFHGYWSVRDQLSLEKFLWWLKPRKKNYCRLLTWKFCWTLSL